MSGERNAAGEPEAAEFHEAANLFPLMSEQMLSELAADIVAHGMREPIWRHRDGGIIDGRNRWLACAKVGVECRHRTYEKGDETIFPFVVSKNLHRRHLTTDQRAAIAADIANLGEGRPSKATAIAAVSQPEAAKLLNVSVGTLQRAAAVKRADLGLHERVKAGEIRAGAARAEIAKAVDAPVIEPEVDGHVDGDADVPTDRDHALAAITAVARLKISGTAAARDYEWTDGEVLMAGKAAKWLKMFVHMVERERRRQNFCR
jgi:ParB-like chromosome segregation protein Spo0J